MINSSDEIKKIKLGEIADISSGQIMGRISAEKEKNKKAVAKMRVIVPKAITLQGFIKSDEVSTEQLLALPDERRITKEGDIVIKLSTPFDSATITKDFVGCLVPSFCAIIRNRGKEIRNDYLQAFLNSTLCKDQLKAKVSGVAMTILSIEKIKEVEVPIIQELIQEDIGNRYRKTQEKIKIFQQIIELETKRNDIVFLNMEQK